MWKWKCDIDVETVKNPLAQDSVYGNGTRVPMPDCNSPRNARVVVVSNRLYSYGLMQQNLINIK